MLVSKNMFPVSSGYNVIAKMNTDLAKLQVQLGTGEKASNLAEMGADRFNSLNLRARLTRLDAYGQNIKTVNTRLSFLDQAFTTLSKLKSEARTSATPNAYGENNLVMVNIQKDSQNRLAMMIDALNIDMGGRYLMGGNVTDTKPVVSYDQMMNGIGSRVGYNTVVQERHQADMGAAKTLGSLGLPQMSTTADTTTISGKGLEGFGYRLETVTASNPDIRKTEPTSTDKPANLSVQFSAQPVAGDTITIGYTKPDGTTGSTTLTVGTDFAIGADENATAANFQAAAATALGALEGPKLGRLNIPNPAGNVVNVTQTGGDFGFKLGTLSTNSAQIGVSGPVAGSMGVTFDGVPQPGDTVTMTMTLPDGTSTTVKMTAVTGAPAAGEFQIGADANETAANFSLGLQAKIGDTTKTVLQAASTYAAADDFFSANGDPQRVDTTGPVALTDATTRRSGAADTVIWYNGQQTGDARTSAQSQIDDGSKVAYGVRANEDGLLNMVRTLAAMSYEGYPVSDPTSKGRFDAMVTRQLQGLSAGDAATEGSVERIALELGVAKNTLGKTSDRQKVQANQLETMLVDVENVNIEETSMMLLALKTRLEASYQTTASVAQLSLVNYLR